MQAIVSFQYSDSITAIPPITPPRGHAAAHRRLCGIRPRRAAAGGVGRQPAPGPAGMGPILGEKAATQTSPLCCLPCLLIDALYPITIQNRPIFLRNLKQNILEDF